MLRFRSAASAERGGKAGELDRLEAQLGARRSSKPQAVSVDAAKARTNARRPVIRRRC
jgi:hypothetical protein